MIFSSLGLSPNNPSFFLIILNQYVLYLLSKLFIFSVAIEIAFSLFLLIRGIKDSANLAKFHFVISG